MSNPFTDVIRELSAGGVAEELTSELTELVRHVQATGKVGSLTYTLKVRPARGNKRAVVLEDRLSVKTPDFDRPTHNLFVDADGGLHRTDPDQRDLPLRGVDSEGEGKPVRQLQGA